MKRWERAAVSAAGFIFGVVMAWWEAALAAPALAVVGIGLWLTARSIPHMTHRAETAGFVALGWGGFGATAVASWTEFGGDPIYLGWSVFVAGVVVISMPIAFTWRWYGTTDREARTKRWAAAEESELQTGAARVTGHGANPTST